MSTLWFTVLYATDRSTNAAPVIIPLFDVLSQVKQLAGA